MNRLHENVVWSMRGNFLDIPTDCPQRDERVGWTGDIQVFAPTAAFLYDCSGMLASWLRDVAVEQLPDGTVPWYVPVIPGARDVDADPSGRRLGRRRGAHPVDALQRFGDADILARQYASAKAWVELVERLAGPDRLWDNGFQLGDWLDPAAPPDDPADARTDRYLVATAYFARSARRLAARPRCWAGRRTRTATPRWRRSPRGVRRRVRAARRPAGQRRADGLRAGARVRPAAGRRCAAGGDAARRAGRGGGTASRPASSARRWSATRSPAPGTSTPPTTCCCERECPSWLYPVTQGATTIWERWDSLRPTAPSTRATMTSFNHYALGAVADWLHRVVAGLAPAAPGYREILFRPRPGGGLTSAAGRARDPVRPGGDRLGCTATT